MIKIIINIFNFNNTLCEDGIGTVLTKIGVIITCLASLAGAGAGLVFIYTDSAEKPKNNRDLIYWILYAEKQHKKKPLVQRDHDHRETEKKAHKKQKKRIVNKQKNNRRQQEYNKDWKDWISYAEETHLDETQYFGTIVEIELLDGNKIKAKLEGIINEKNGRRINKIWIITIANEKKSLPSITIWRFKSNKINIVSR